MLTPEQRSQRARIAALARWAKEDATSQGQKAQDTHVRKWADEVDAEAASNGEHLTEEQRQRRINTKRRLYMTKLSFASSKARAARKSGAGDAA